jgi:type I restriction enzyme S subunit
VANANDMTVPDGWEAVALADLATIRYGKSRPKEPGGVPAVGSGGVYAHVAKPLIEVPTVIVGRKGTAGMAWHLTKPCWPSDTTFYLEWNHLTAGDQTAELSEFVYHCLRNRPLSGEHAKTTLPSLQKADLENYVIPLPPPSERRSILNVLRTVQQAKEATERVIAATKELKQSLMRHLFTYGPVPVDQADQVELKETVYGEGPAPWTTVPLSDVADISYGVQAAVAHLTDASVGLPILTNVNITLGGRIDLSTLRYFDLPEKKRDKLVLQRNDVLFNWRSGSDKHIGKTAIFDLDGEYTFSSFILRFRSKGTVEPRFLIHYLTWLKESGYFIRYRQQSSVNKVFNASAASRLPVVQPPVEVQLHISSLIDTVMKKESAEISRRVALQELLDSLLGVLMTGEVRLEPA